MVIKLRSKTSWSRFQSDFAIFFQLFTLSKSKSTKWYIRGQMWLKKSFVSILQSNLYFYHNYQKRLSPSGGLEPPTFRLTVERASQLRHEGSVIQRTKKYIENLFWVKKARSIHIFLLHFVAFFHVASLLSTGVDNDKVEVDNEKALELTNSTVFHDHAKHSGLNSIFCCLKMNQFWTF